jgi:hypothetical protein
MLLTVELHWVVFLQGCSLRYGFLSYSSFFLDKFLVFMVVGVENAGVA